MSDNETQAEHDWITTFPNCRTCGKAIALEQSYTRYPDKTFDHYICGLKRRFR